MALPENQSSHSLFSFQSEESSTRVPVDKEFFIRKTLETNVSEGIELLFKKYYKPLCSHAIRFVYSKQIAEDLVTEVFLQFWTKKQYLQVKTSYKAYLFTVVRYRAFAYLRAELGKAPDEITDDLLLASPMPTADQMLQYDELYLKLDKIIKELPPQIQKVFLLSRFEGKKYTEIASEMNISQKTVEAHITKALKIVKAALKNEWFITSFLVALLLLF